MQEKIKEEMQREYKKKIKEQEETIDEIERNAEINLLKKKELDNEKIWI